MALLSIGFCAAGVAQSQVPAVSHSDGVPSQSQSAASSKDLSGQPDSQAKGSITGTVTFQGGGVAVGAQVRLTREGQPPVEILSNDDGWYAFANQPPGPFRLTILADGFETTEYWGTSVPGLESAYPTS